MSLVEFNNVYKRYKTGEIVINAVDGISFKVEEGEFAIVVGASGAGKTTVLNILGGMDSCSEGEIIVGGKDISKFKDKQLIEYRRHDIGFVFQFYNLVHNLTAKENVELAAQICSNPLDSETALDSVGLLERANNFPAQLSGGEQQRVAIAIALSNNPSLLLADEPTGAVDTKTAAMVLDVFKQLNRQMGVTIIIVTHDTNLSKSIDRVVAIRDGRTSSEMLRKKTEILSFGELEKMSEQQRAEHEKLMQQSGSDQEELVVLDRAGRLQIPKEYLEALGIRGGDKVRVELEDGKISVYNSDYNSHG